MGIYDRDYSQSGYRPMHSGQHMGMRFPSPTPAVKWLLIINIAVFLLSSYAPIGNFLVGVFAVMGLKGSFLYSIQIWRYIGYQFLHADVMHILMNMLGLYFLGPVLERNFGSERFVKFYLGCGAVGGILYSLFSAFGFFGQTSYPVPLVGASGAILGMLAVCAIKFPHFVVFFMFFPVPIRVAAIILIVIYVANLVSKGANAGGDLAHLSGMAAGAAYVFWPRFKFHRKMQESWADKKAQEIKNIEADVDLILDKVSREGIASLTRHEKQLLKRATKIEQGRERF